MTQALVAWAPALLWAAVLFLLSAQPDLDGPSWLPMGDKVGHLVLYGVLGAALAWGRRRGRHDPSHALLVLMGAAYGASDEWHQSFVPGRDPSLGDLVADTLGVALGYALVLALLRHLDVGGRTPSPSDA